MEWKALELNEIYKDRRNYQVAKMEQGRLHTIKTNLVNFRIVTFKLTDKALSLKQCRFMTKAQPAQALFKIKNRLLKALLKLYTLQG